MNDEPDYIMTPLSLLGVGGVEAKVIWTIEYGDGRIATGSEYLFEAGKSYRMAALVANQIHRSIDSYRGAIIEPQ